jgi:hypothetical protein
MMQKKKKRDLIATIQHIERFHRRRSEIVIHATLSLAFQFALWANWYASYAVVGRGFDNNFFANRAIVSAVLLIFLAGHFLLTYLTESKDRLVIQALQQRQNDYDDDAENDIDVDNAENMYKEEDSIQSRRKW